MSIVRRCPFADLWVDPFDGFCSIVPASWDSGDTAGFVNARVDWKGTPESEKPKPTMSTVRRCPFADLWVDPFDGSCSIVPASWNSDTAGFVNARVDWKETPEAHVFKADLPGVKKEEVKLEVEDGNVLVISGERTKEQEDNNHKWHRVERSSGKFVRRFQLPENAKVEEVKAGLEDGVLTVTVPKVEIKKPEVKAIEISG